LAGTENLSDNKIVFKFYIVE